MSFIIDGIDFQNLTLKILVIPLNLIKGDPKGRYQEFYFLWRLYWRPQDGWRLLSFY